MANDHADATQANRPTLARLVNDVFGVDASPVGRLRRCFMNGKPCSYCGGLGGELAHDKRVALGEGASNLDASTSDESVFVVMPFRPNLDTFFEWSLLPYLSESISGLRKEHIRRADTYRNIGYVMCEKICRRIQDSSLVVVDISLDNPNVFYELGLAVGLGKPLLVVCDENRWKLREQRESLLRAIGLAKEGLRAEPPILIYPNVGFIDGRLKPISKYITRVRLERQQQQMAIVPLLVWDHPSKDPRDDIDVTFEQSLKAALGVALRELRLRFSRGDACAVLDAIAELETKVQDMGSDRNSKLYLFNATENGRQEPRSFQDVASQVTSSFACIIDLAGELPLSYFWLGYCHARGVNVIPIYRDGGPNAKTSSEDTMPWMVTPLNSGQALRLLHEEQSANRGHVLAFDIRALWYIDYRDKDSQGLVELLSGVLEELVTRDVPRRERSVFWKRLTRQSKVHIFTGALHNPELTREMVGDWDLRAVSELVRYLSSTDESVVSELEPPIYGAIKRKGADGLKAYLQHACDRLRGRNCLIIASPDVNPLTEIALAKVYQAEEYAFRGKDPAVCNRIRHNMVIALKGSLSEAPQKNTSKDDECEYPPFFSRYHQIPDGHRGFLLLQQPVSEPYHSQKGSQGVSKFSVLGHLVVMPNLFSDPADDSVIVVLNGVSGPATLGLAEILTGGAGGIRAADAEKLLKCINDAWDKASSERSSGFRGVEMIIRVTIETGHAPNQFADVRTVAAWERWIPDEETGKTTTNPRRIS